MLPLSNACFGQSPVANRVNTAAENLPPGAHAVARYTDDEVHSLYYIMYDRLFRYDVLTDDITEVRLASEGYLTISDVQVFDGGQHFFVTIDVDDERMANNQELWMIAPENGTAHRIAAGFAIEKHKACYIVKRNISIIDPHVAKKDRRWRARDEYFDFSGMMIRALEEYDNGPL